MGYLIAGLALGLGSLAGLVWLLYSETRHAKTDHSPDCPQVMPGISTGDPYSVLYPPAGLPPAVKAQHEQAWVEAIAAGAVEADKIGAGAVTAGKLAARCQHRPEVAPPGESPK